MSRQSAISVNSSAASGLAPVKSGYSGKIESVGSHTRSNPRAVSLTLEKAMREKSPLQAAPTKVTLEVFEGRSGTSLIPVFHFDLGPGVTGTMPAFETGFYKAAEEVRQPHVKTPPAAPVPETVPEPEPDTEELAPEMGEQVSLFDPEVSAMDPIPDSEKPETETGETMPEKQIEDSTKPSLPVKHMPFSRSIEQWKQMSAAKREQIHWRMVDALGIPMPFCVLSVKKGPNGTTARLNRKIAVESLSAAAWSSMEVGRECVVLVTGISPGKVYCETDGITAMLPVGEIDHAFISDIRRHISVGSAYKAKVIAVDREEEVITVSTKALLPDPWETAKESYKPGDFVTGTAIVNSQRNGKHAIRVQLPSGLSAVAQVPAFYVVQTGASVVIRLIEINPAARKISAVIARVLEPASGKSKPGYASDKPRRQYRQTI